MLKAVGGRALTGRDRRSGLSLIRLTELTQLERQLPC